MVFLWRFNLFTRKAEVQRKYEREEGEKGEGERERENLSSVDSLPNGHNTRSVPGWSQESGTPSEIPTRVEVSMHLVLPSSSIAFPGSSAGTWITSQAAGTPIGADKEWLHCRWLIKPLGHKTNSSHSVDFIILLLFIFNIKRTNLCI